MRSKRAFDVLAGSVLLLAAVPVLAGVWLAMRITGDEGPFLFRSVRAGRDGRPFTLLKVRTMRAGAGGPGLTLARDPRVTPLGRLLRRYRIDELPQLVNVVRGEMSLVGPRPEDPRYVDASDPVHRRVLAARPGITGLAQLAYTHEDEQLAGADPEGRYRAQILPAKLRLDAAYLDRRSLWLDLRIMTRTIGTLLAPARAGRHGGRPPAEPPLDAPRAVAMAVYGDLTYDSRVRREATSLAEHGFEVTLYCLANGRVDDLPAGVDVRVIRPTRTTVTPGVANPFLATAAATGWRRRRVEWLRDYVLNVRSWGRLVVASEGTRVVWHLHDLPALAAVAPRLPRRQPFVYDAHELFLEAGTAARLPFLLRWVLRAWERRLVARAAAVLTVNDALADELRRRYRPARIAVVHNCPDVPDARARPDLLRAAAGVPASAPVIVYHGALARDRGVEQLLDALLDPCLRDAHLVLLGFGERRDAYRAAAAEPALAGRVHVLDPVPPSELLDWIATADVGAMPIQPTTLNHRLSTPNKLFECIAAGVPVVTSDFPAMRRIVGVGPDDRLGVMCDPANPSAVAGAVREILDLDPAAREAMVARGRAAAATRWNWTSQAEALLGVHEEIAAARSAAARPSPGAGRGQAPEPQAVAAR